MGVWTWLERYDVPIDGPSEPAPRAELRARLLRAYYEDEGAPRPTAVIDTHRGWHALHVALTGSEDGGEPPAADVMGVTPETFHDWDEVRWPDEVRRIACYLDEVCFEDALFTLRTASDQGVYVYSEEMWNDEALRRVFDDVRAFYSDAARRGQIVALHRR